MFEDGGHLFDLVHIWLRDAYYIDTQHIARAFKPLCIVHIAAFIHNANLLVDGMICIQDLLSLLFRCSFETSIFPIHHHSSLHRYEEYFD